MNYYNLLKRDKITALDYIKRSADYDSDSDENKVLDYIMQNYQV